MWHLSVHESWYVSPSLGQILTPYPLFAEMYWTEANGGEINYASSDFWSLGIVFTEMLAKTLPWGAAHWDDESFGAFLDDPKYFQRHLGISKQANAIPNQTLELESQFRITLPKLGNRSRTQMCSLGGASPTRHPLDQCGIGRGEGD